MNIRKFLWLKKGGYVKALFFLFSVYCLVHGTVSGQPHPYKFHYLTVDEGLSHTDANDIAQDKQGYIWIATYFGIAVKIRHTSNAKERLEQAHKVMGISSRWVIIKKSLSYESSTI